MTKSDKRPGGGIPADARLEQLVLTRASLLAAADYAHDAYIAGSVFSSRQAPSIKMWLDGIEGLRAEHVGENWRLYERDGLEGIITADGSIIVLFQGCERCCGNDLPRPRTRKGSAPENLQLNLFEAQGISLEAEPKAGPAVYYLVVDNDGRAELMHAVVRNGAFIHAWERIFLRTEGRSDLAVTTPDVDDDDLTISIARK